ncbi:hypothetical protein [Leucobacter denitrificans]|uniref:hypothetical protein n=1 Tax=Leucobacter denitrificans TaxID=683042 RepID=UPI001FE9A72D|nr:hypothetical protein [Leucobacter denitrificans]
MKRTQKVLIASGVGVIVLGVLVALAGPPIYRDFIAPPAAEAPTLMGDPSLTGESEVPALDGPSNRQILRGPGRSLRDQLLGTESMRCCAEPTLR